MSLNNVGGLGIDLLVGRNTATPGLRGFRDEFAKTEKAIGRGAGKVEKVTLDVDQALGQMAAGAATVGIGVGIMAAPFALATKAAGPFQDALAQLQAISGASAAEMVRLHDAAIDAGVATQFDPTQAAAALGDLAAAGFSVSESLALMRPTLDLAAGSLGQLSPSDAAGLASQAMKAFGIQTDGAAMAVDQMLASVNVFALAAKDLPLALGTAARGAGTLNQSLDETLVALGLVKNIVPGVERASTAVSTSMERMADPKVQKALKGLGVSAVDSAGDFRPFLDVVGDMIPELNKMTAAKRSAFLIDTFGTEALAGFNAITTQLNTGIKTTTGETLTGADAIKYYRDQFKSAGGTAAKFAKTLLDTFPGQLKLLSGSLSTLGVVVGEEFASAFKPMVEKAVNGLNTVIEFVRGMSPEMKSALAKLVIGLTTGLGGLIAVGGALKVLGPALAFVKAAFLGVGGTAGLVIGGLVLAVVALKAAYDANLGGLARSFDAAMAKVRLAYQITAQLFSQGGVSGAIREEFFRAENSGVRAFAVTLYTVFSRVKAFVVEFVTGFKEAIGRADGSFAMLFGAVRRLGEAFGFVAETPGEAGQSFDKFAEAGLSAGQLVAKGVAKLVDVLTLVVDFWASFKKQLDLGPVLPTILGAFRSLGEAVGSITTALGGLTGSLGGSGSALAAVGGLVGTTFTFAIRAAANVVQTLGTMVANAGQVIGGALNIVVGLLTGNFSRAWLGVKQVVFGVVSAVVDSFGALIQFVANGLDQLNKLRGVNTTYGADVGKWRANFREGLMGGMGVDAAHVEAATAPPAVMTANSVSMPPTALPAAMVSSGFGASASFDEGMMSRMPDAVAAAVQKTPINVTVNVGDEELASFVSRASTESGARGAIPQASEE
jgi:TP901 family phage tail tape measure protein